MSDWMKGDVSIANLHFYSLTQWQIQRVSKVSIEAPFGSQLTSNSGKEHSITALPGMPRTNLEVGLHADSFLEVHRR